jgi:3-hydroxy-3-methylglutaryl CoA synthase
MIGITSYGAYIPLWRLSREKLGDALSGEKVTASFDEDSITMAVAAAVDCLDGIDRQSVDGLFFASTTSPYKEKLAAATVATAIDLRRDVITADFGNSLRAGTIAVRSASDSIKAGRAKRILVIAADCRLGTPGSVWEQNCSDGAAALLIGDSEIAAILEADYSIYNEMLDVWRADTDTFIRSWEARFIETEGYLEVTHEAVSTLMNKSNLNVQDFNKVILSLPKTRRQIDLASSLGFDSKTQLQDSLLSAMGDTGSAYPLMLLVAVLEGAEAGHRILLASYGNGSDAMVLRLTEQIQNIRDRRGIKKHLESKRMIADYRTYLRWRGLLPETRPPYNLGEIAPTALWRENDQNIRFHGVRCKNCGTIQYPPQQICTKFHMKGEFDKVRLSDKRGEVFTYSLDHVSWALEMPTAYAVVNFEGGGRIESVITDRVVEEVTIGMPVEMSFRRLDFRQGIHNYSWKCIPLRL